MIESLPYVKLLERDNSSGWQIARLGVLDGTWTPRSANFIIISDPGMNILTMRSCLVIHP